MTALYSYIREKSYNVYTSKGVRNVRSLLLMKFPVSAFREESKSRENGGDPSLSASRR